MGLQPGVQGFDDWPTAVLPHLSPVFGRMAADPSVRGQGHGAAVLAELHCQAVLRGLRQVELHAQVTARRFYERAGYVVVGDEYEEAGIRHVTMRRSLS